MNEHTVEEMNEQTMVDFKQRYVSNHILDLNNEHKTITHTKRKHHVVKLD